MLWREDYFDDDNELCVCVWGGGGDLSVHFVFNTFPDKTVI